MPSFTDLGVRSDIVTRLAARGVVEPFPIQAATIADGLAGRDVCGKAPTGSGKTIAFGIPLVSIVKKASPRAPRGLVLVPTRELANQVAEELTQLAGPKARVATVFGGVSYGNQLRALRRGADIVVACPGRLKDLVQRNECRLDDVEFVVLDEADRMADMGFLPEVRRLLDMVGPNRQTLLFSATLDGDISTLIERYQNNPVTHEVEADDDAPQNVHHFVRTPRADRVKKAAELVSAEWPAIVFCRTKHGADRLATQFEALGVTAAAIHGDRSQAQRERALRAFTNGKVQCLVATDIAARGIHVDKVASVVHFDPPADEKDYIHRSGRTGRAGLAGIVYSLILPEQARASATMQRRLGLEVATSAERPDRAERIERPARPFTPSRGHDRPTSTERAERSERSGNGAYAERPARASGPRPGGRQARGQANTNWEPRPKGGGKSYSGAGKPSSDRPSSDRSGAGRPSAGRNGSGAPKPGRPGNRKSRRTAA